MSPYSAAVLVDNPFAYWPLDEVRGGALDISSLGTHNGTYPIDGNITRGIVGPGGMGCSRAVQFLAAFPGHTSILLNNPSTLPLSPRQMSIEVWLQPTFTGVGGRFDTVVSWGPDITDNSQLPTWILEMGVQTAGDISSLFLNDREFSATNAGVSGTINIGVGNWTHFALGMDRDTPANDLVYVNGAPWSGGTLFHSDTDTQPGPITFGAIGFNSQQEGWVGGMAHLAIYTSCLTPTQIGNHYAASTCEVYPAAAAGHSQIYLGY